MEKINELQKAIGQVGTECVQRYLPKGMKLYTCDIHGGFIQHYSNKNPLCPLCQCHDTKANGETASDVQLYIDIRDDLDPPCNPHY